MRVGNDGVIVGYKQGDDRAMMGCKWAFMGYSRISAGNGGIMGNVSRISTGRATISDRRAIGGGV